MCSYYIYLVLLYNCFHRSCPRPPLRASLGKAMRQQVPASARHCIPKTLKSSRQEKNTASSHVVGLECSCDIRAEIASTFTDHNSDGILPRVTNKSTQPVMERYVEPTTMEFSDATSSDWSLFTSSDEASFTSESARDSFSTVDYSDTNGDPVSTFKTGYAESASANTVCCWTFPNSKPQTRFSVEKKGYVSDSHLSTQSTQKLHRVDEVRQVDDSSAESSSDSNCSMFVNYRTCRM